MTDELTVHELIKQAKYQLGRAGVIQSPDEAAVAAQMAIASATIALAELLQEGLDPDTGLALHVAVCKT